MAMTFDEPQFRARAIVYHYVAIHATTCADDLFGIGRMKAEHGRKCQAGGIDAVAAEGETRAAAVDDYRREHTKRMTPNAMFRVALLSVAHIGQLTDEAERAVVAQS